MIAITSRRFPTPGRTLLRALPVATLLLSALLAPAAQAGNWEGTQETVEGVVKVHNPAEGIDPEMTIELEEVFRLGGWNGGDDEFFGVIADIHEDDEGNLYVLDAQLNEIKIYDSQGVFLNTIGREGEGPGEFRNASALFELPNGDLGVIQTFPSKVVTLTKDGEPGADFSLAQPEGGSGFFIVQGAERAGDQLAVMYSFRYFDQATSKFTATTRLSLFDASGTEVAQLHEHVGGMDFANPIISEQQFDNFGARWTVASNGRIASTEDLENYRIRVWGPDGGLDRVIDRAYPPHERTQQERDELVEIYKGFTRNQPLPPNTKYEVNPVHPAIDREGIQARPDGSLWVLSSRGSDDEDEAQLGTFDIYDPKGRLVRQATLNGQCDNTQDRILFVGDRIYVITEFLGSAMALQGGGGTGEVEEDDAEPMSLICYRSDQLDVAASIPKASSDSR